MSDWIQHDENLPSHEGWNTMSTYERVNIIFFCIFIVVAYLLRNHKQLGFMWKLIKGVFVLVLFCLAIDYTKNKVKEWWSN
jgi:hypothetical protein